METENNKFDLLPGRIFLLNNQNRYISSHDKSHPLTVQAIHFDYKQKLDHLPFFTAMLHDSNYINTIYSRVHYYFNRGKIENAGQWVEMLINEVIFTIDNQRTVDYQQKKIESLVESIRNDPAKKWTLKQMSEMLNISPNHLSRLFRKRMGVSPHTFVINCRIDMARQLLLSSSYSISLIGEMCGYSDIYFFSRQFKQNTGIPPAIFRKEGIICN